VSADPTHEVFAKPIIPTHRGNIELHLGGHSLVRRERWGPDTPHASKVLEVVRNDLARTVADAEAAANLIGDRRGLGVGERQELQDRALAVPGKVLGAALLKYGVPEEMLQPDPRKPIERRTPETTLSDDFNRANGAVGSNWTVTDGAFAINSNRLRGSSTNASVLPASMRYNSDLSTPDHYSQCDYVAEVAGDGNNVAGGIARFSSSALTFYFGFVRRGGSLRHLRKTVAGTVTVLANDTGGSGPPHAQVRTTADGSTISFSVAGVGVFSVTDSSITGHLRAGVGHHSSLTVQSDSDNWLAEDLLAPPAFQPRRRYNRIGQFRGNRI